MNFKKKLFLLFIIGFTFINSTFDSNNINLIDSEYNIDDNNFYPDLIINPNLFIFKFNMNINIGLLKINLPIPEIDDNYFPSNSTSSTTRTSSIDDSNVELSNFSMDASIIYAFFMLITIILLIYKRKKLK